MASHVRVAIVGSGFAGLGTAIRLKQRGISDFVVLERADEIGGRLARQRLPGLRLRRPLAPLLVLVRAEPGVDARLLAAAGDLGVPPALRAPVRARAAPAPRPRAPGGALGRGGPALAARHLARRVHRRRARRRRGRAERAVDPRAPRARALRGEDDALRPLGRELPAARKARRGRRHRRVGDPDRAEDRARGGAAHPAPAHPALGDAALGPAALGPEARGLPLRARSPAARARGDLHRPRGDGARLPAPGADAARPAHRPAPHRAGDLGSGAAREADPELHPRLQAGADLERLLPCPRAPERRGGDRGDPRGHARARCAWPTGPSARSTR